MSTAEDLCAQASACLSEKNVRQAIKLLEEAVESDPDLVVAHENLAGLCFLTKDYERAVQLYQRAMRLDPKNSAAMINLGAVYNKMKNYQEAVKTLRSALSRDRRSPEAYYNLGIAHKGLNQLSMAVSAYKEAIRLDPEMAEAYSNLGNVLIEMKNHSQAILNYRRAVELKPNFKKAIVGLRKAEEQAYEAKQSHNPFGRLVNMEDVERKNKEVEKTLVLTAQQRYEDREIIHRLAKDGQRIAEEVVEQVKQELEASILELSRLMSEERDSRTWLSHQKQFRLAVENFRQNISSLKEKVEQIRDHERHIESDFCSN
ncbi:TPR repeat-containing protein YrrB [Thalassoglobus neptunius]|uniref:TPR repeat-containing protein YrrB n=1 Tax=Thalassoglobus neptunius TaxID=1938619 RepID=A0A5C5WIS5_9PLAN|nr:tetratricopeptide repeat protein [Thalassoglobus neptunius]TWT49911.1 TPR repeat-containing protein YrrB [Thalassoglobus neptunius]